MTFQLDHSIQGRTRSTNIRHGLRGWLRLIVLRGEILLGRGSLIAVVLRHHGERALELTYDDAREGKNGGADEGDAAVKEPSQDKQAQRRHGWLRNQLWDRARDERIRRRRTNARWRAGHR
jgi:hypothetical protein